jgi:hypothetical protein
VTEHDAVPVVDPAASVQNVAGENTPKPLDENVTVPVGALTVPAFVSVTVVVHIVGIPTATLVGEQLTAVEVVRTVTCWVQLPLLVA